MNIAVVVAGDRGDVLRATPLLRTLVAEVPAAHLIVFGPRDGDSVAGSLPGVAEWVPLPVLGGRPGRLAALRLVRQFRPRRLHAIVLCLDRASSRWAGYLAGIPIRAGVSRGWTGFLLSERAHPGPRENDVAGWLRLAPMLGIPRIHHHPQMRLPSGSNGHTDALLLQSQLGGRRLMVALAPGLGRFRAHDSPPPAGASPMLWPPARYAHLANSLARRHAAGVVIVGDEADRDAVDVTLTDLEAPHVDLCGELDFYGTAAVLARCDLLVTADGPLLHVAAAVGTPTIGVFGVTDGSRRGAYGAAHVAVQALTADVAAIRVEDVLAAIESA